MSDLKDACAGASPAKCEACGQITLLRIEIGDGVVPLCSIVCHADWVHRRMLERAEKAEARAEKAERERDEAVRARWKAEVERAEVITEMLKARAERDAWSDADEAEVQRSASIVYGTLALTSEYKDATQERLDRLKELCLESARADRKSRVRVLKRSLDRCRVQRDEALGLHEVWEKAFPEEEYPFPREDRT